MTGKDADDVQPADDTEDSIEVQRLPLGELQPNPANPSFPYDEEREPLEPVREGEYEQNPQVTPDSHFTNADWTIISGERRIRDAINHHGWNEIKVEIVRYGSKEEEERAVLLSNAHRTRTPGEQVIYVESLVEYYRDLSTPNLEIDDAVEAACKHVEMSSSTYYSGKRIKRAAEEGLWGLRGPKEMDDSAVDVAREQWERLTRGDASIGNSDCGAYQSVESAMARAKRKKKAEDGGVQGCGKGQPDIDLDGAKPIQGEYNFLPVFGWNEAQAALQLYKVEQSTKTEDELLACGEIRDDIFKIDGRDLTWWEDNSIIPKHPYLLVNPVSLIGWTDKQDDAEVFRYGDDQFVFSDSGGFQILKNKAEIADDPSDHQFSDDRIYPEKLVEWQVANADAGATLEFPPYKNNNGSIEVPGHPDDWQAEFYHCMEESAEMVARMSTKLQEMREQGDQDAQEYDFCPVLHGRPHPGADDPHEYVEHWTAAMQEKTCVETDGWVLKPHPNNHPGQVAFWLGYAAEKLQEVDYLHVLMIGLPREKALLKYYSMLTGQHVTSDNSSYSVGGKFRQYNLSGTAGRRAIEISNRGDNSAQMDRYPCRCQVCEAVEKEYGIEFITEGGGSGTSSTMNLHNLNIQLTLDSELEQLLHREGVNVVLPDGQRTGEDFWSYMRDLYDDEEVEDLTRAMTYIRTAYEDGLDTANEQYRMPWSGTAGRTIEDRSRRTFGQLDYPERIARTKSAASASW